MATPVLGTHRPGGARTESTAGLHTLQPGEARLGVVSARLARVELLAMGRTRALPEVVGMQLPMRTSAHGGFQECGEARRRTLAWARKLQGYES